MSELKFNYIFVKKKSTLTEEEGIFLFCQGKIDIFQPNVSNITDYNTLIQKLRSLDENNTQNFIQQFNTVTNIIIGLYKKHEKEFTLLAIKTVNEILINQIKLNQTIFKSEKKQNGTNIQYDKGVVKEIKEEGDFVFIKIEIQSEIIEQRQKNKLQINTIDVNVEPDLTGGNNTKKNQNISLRFLPNQVKTRHFTKKVRPSNKK